MSERLWDIPPTWEWSRIGELGNVVSGGTPPTKVSKYWEGDIIWFAPSDLTGYKRKFIERGAKTLTKVGLAKSSAKLMPAGSVMFSSRAPVGYTAINTKPSATNQGFKSIVPHDGLFNEYLYYYLQAAKQIAEQRATGTTFKELSGSAFGALPVPLAPTCEQRRIVEKIEALFAEIDKGVESLQAAKSTLDLYRKSLLKSAFEGRLTADWRSRNSDKLEDSDTLLSRIRKEREANYQAALSDWQRAVANWKERGEQSKKPAKPRKPRKLSITEDIVALAGWARVPLGLLIAYPIYGTSKKCSYGVGEKGVLRIPNLAALYIDQSDLKSADFDEAENDKYSLIEGDVLTIRSNGSLSVVGKPAIVREQDTDLLFAGYLIRLRPIMATLVPMNLVYMMMAPIVREQIEIKAKSTSGVNNISARELQELLVPICAPDEQAEIVRILDARFEALEFLDLEINVAFTRAEALRQSILKQAFSGKLVPQDPKNEPASVLLSRIKAESAPKRRKPATRERKAAHR
ncbi:MAG: restriction endonuclease subunit S [Gammaproteobacteria bacterium]|nr:restriction endonuclease subunit S [Gammaproteobacteria bacterium]MCY3689949.1 restriction endonuclease subunit S [Gammaproteobacteria bacterium]